MMPIKVLFELDQELTPVHQPPSFGRKPVGCVLARAPLRTDVLCSRTELCELFQELFNEPSADFSDLKLSSSVSPPGDRVGDVSDTSR